MSTTETLATLVSTGIPDVVEVTKSPIFGIPLLPLYKKSASAVDDPFIVYSAVIGLGVGKAGEGIIVTSPDERLDIYLLLLFDMEVLLKSSSVPLVIVTGPERVNVLAAAGLPITTTSPVICCVASLSFSVTISPTFIPEESSTVIVEELFTAAVK